MLARYAQAYARELSVAESRVRAWVAYMIMAGTLERVTDVDGPLFILKGGVALELRLRDDYSSARSDGFRDRCGQWIDEEEDRIRDIESSIDRIGGWLQEERGKL